MMEITVDLLKYYAVNGSVILKNLPDLELDLQAIDEWRAKGAKSMLWLVKESGTIMLPLRMAVDTGVIEVVDKERAMQLIWELPFDIASAGPSDLMEHKVRELLGQRYVTDNVFREATLDPDTDSLERWKQYFERINNQLMVKLLAEVMPRAV